jgi:hypothetical protein
MIRTVVKTISARQKKSAITAFWLSTPVAAFMAVFISIDANQWFAQSMDAIPARIISVALGATVFVFITIVTILMAVDPGQIRQDIERGKSSEQE